MEEGKKEGGKKGTVDRWKEGWIDGRINDSKRNTSEEDIIRTESKTEKKVFIG